MRPVAVCLTLAMSVAASVGVEPPTTPHSEGPFAIAGWDSTQTPDSPETASSPTTTIATVPSSSVTLAASPSNRGRIVIHGTGDVSLDDRQVRGAFTTNGYSWGWSGLGGVFQRDDLTVVNLECSPSTLGAPRDKKFTFRCDLPGLEVMAASGIEVANMANNHAGDFGRSALLDGRANLIRLGILPVGAGRDLAQASQAAYIEVEGWTIAVLGFSLVTGGEGWFAGANWSGVARADEATVVAAIAAADAVADLIVVSVHWGEEGDRSPRPINRQRAEAMIGAGADVIFGHHSHRRNPMEMIDGKPVFWGLGNFVWPDLGLFSSQGAMGEVVVDSDGSITGRLLYSLVESNGHPVLLTQPDWTLRSGPNRLQ